MGFWNKRSQPPNTEKRDTGMWPALPLGQLGGLFGRTYQEVNPTVGETALQSVAYAASCNLLAGLISELPIDVYSGEGAGRRRWTTPGNVLDPAGDGYGVEDWIYQTLMSYFLRGNLIGLGVDIGESGMYRQVDVLNPERVSVHPDDDARSGFAWYNNGTRIPDRRVIHRRAFPTPGCLLGASPVERAADQLGLSLTVTRFGRSWFQDGGHPSGLLTNSEADLSDPAQSQTAKDRFLAAIFGNREPVVLGKGWDYKQIQIAPEESQFLETTGWTEAQCARILGPGLAEILGYASGGSMTYTNVVDRDLALLKYTAGPWIRRTERLLSRFLPNPRYVKLNRDALLETNAYQRWQINKIRLDSGASFINEIRDQEDQQPVEWGNEPFKLDAAPVDDPESDNADDRDPERVGAGGAE